MYREFKNLDLPKIDQDILAFWEEDQIFKKSVEERDPENAYVFYEGPPSANGKPGIHHVLARTIKDIFCRFHTMLGQYVERRGGWDTHGLPIELSVEKELGITKEDIGTKISVEEYNKMCRKTVMRYKDLWDDLTVKMGYWVDLDNPYITFKNEYIESIWYLLKTMYDKGLLYKGYTIQPYSPAAGTGLSSHELNMPGAYREVKDTSVVAQFKVLRDQRSEFLFEVSEGKPVYLLAWTTTPWTLPSNVALAVGKKIEYKLIQTFNAYTGEEIHVVLATDLMPQWFDEELRREGSLDYDGSQKKIPHRVALKCKGSDLDGLRYEQLLHYATPEGGDAFKVVLGDFVSTEEGTGIVHIAPSFGADDLRMARQYGLGALTLVDRQGRFVEEVTDFAGRYVKDYRDQGKDYQNVDIDIAVKLKKENKAFNVQKYTHNYPHCWRTDKPVLYYPLDSWFIRSTEYKDKMIELNRTINWQPAHTGEKRFGNWLENLQDWNLSRSRFWGTPLPIWRTADGSEEICIGSVAELKDEIERANAVLGLSQSVPPDLHRPYIDSIVLVSESGREMRRELDLIDVWFDSGSMPYAQWHYPFEHREEFDRNFPADFIAEGVDQTRGWFFTLHAIAAMTFESVSFRNVVSNGLVLDKYGRKMSKRLGNAADPFDTLATYGADATRWYMIANNPPWDNLKFDPDGIEEVKRKFFGTLFNTYAFFALYANIDKFRYSEARVPVAQRPEIDRWILSALNTLSGQVRQAYTDYDPTAAARAVQNFTLDDLSNWYVRLCRRRFWKGDYSADKIAAFQTLYDCLQTIAKIMSPIAPFFGEWLYKNLNDITGKEPHNSVHLAFFPERDEEALDLDLEKRMNYAQRISSLVLSLRKKENLRVRQPLKRILLPVVDEKFEEDILKVKDLILSEVNVKDIEFITDTSDVLRKSIKPNYKTLGKRLGPHMKEAAEIIGNFSQETIRKIEDEEHYTLETDRQQYDLDIGDFIITSEDIPGWQVSTDRNLTVALDVSLDDLLIAEGTARDIINRIQNLRKKKNYQVTDKIVVRIEPHQAVKPALDSFGPYIASETLADEIIVTSELSEAEEIELHDNVKIAVQLSLAGAST
jgi:isoleucyl-tRNA synthetase